MKHNHTRKFQIFIIPAIIVIGLMALAVYMSIAYISVTSGDDQELSSIRSHSEISKE